MTWVWSSREKGSACNSIPWQYLLSWPCWAAPIGYSVACHGVQVVFLADVPKSGCEPTPVGPIWSLPRNPCLLLPTTAYRSLPQPTTAYRSLPQPTAAYSSLPQPTTAYLSLLLPTYHCLPQPTTAFCSLPQPTTAYRSLPLPIPAYHYLLIKVYCHQPLSKADCYTGVTRRVRSPSLGLQAQETSPASI